MRPLAIIGEVLTVLGPIGVLGLWLYQQTAVEERANELRRLSGAKAVFQTYQSNNALFNAINEVVGKDAAETARIRSFQIYNYELGLAAIEGVLSPEDKGGIPPRVDAYGDGDVAAKMQQIQTRLSALQTALERRQAAIGQEAAATRKTYFAMYILLALLSIGGAMLKVIDKFTATA